MWNFMKLALDASVGVAIITQTHCILYASKYASVYKAGNVLIEHCDIILKYLTF